MDMLESYLKQIQEAGFAKYPKGWDKESVVKFSKSLVKGGATKKDFFDKCVEKMRGKFDNPEAFCASVKDVAFASTFWRGKGKTPKEAEKAIRTHKRLRKHLK